MRAVTTCIICILFTFIAFISVVIPNKSAQQSRDSLLPEPLDQTKALIVISTDLFDLMFADDFTGVGLYTVSGKPQDPETGAVFIPCWNDIEYKLGMTGDQRRYYIFSKVKDALNRDGIWQLRIVPLAKNTNAEA